MVRRASQSMLSASMSPSRTTSPRAFTNRHSITLSMRLSTSFRVPLSRIGALPSTFAMRSSSLAFAEQMRAVRLSTCALHMASSWGLLGSRRSLSIVYLLISVSEAPDAAGVFHACPSKAQRKTFERPPQGLCSGRGAKWAQHSPAKDLRRGFVRTGARKGLRTAHRKTSKSPSKAGALLLILFRGIPEHLGKKQGEHPHNGCSPCSGNGHLHATERERAGL